MAVIGGPFMAQYLFGDLARDRLSLRYDLHMLDYDENYNVIQSVCAF